MKFYKEFLSYTPDIIKIGKKKFDNTIYTFDIETTSFLKYNEKIDLASNYLSYSEKEKNYIEYYSTMYIWQFSINDEIFFGRTWLEFLEFLYILNTINKEKKIVFVHNLSFEFQFLKQYIKFTKVFARKSRKVITAYSQDYNIEFRCSYYMSNVSLEKLSQVYNLNVKKQVGFLDYNKLRHSATPLSDEELKYCEYDCKVVYEYIKFLLKDYKRIDKIPKTSTGQLRQELKEYIKSNDKNWKYKIRKAISENPKIFNVLEDSFMGGYTHANLYYTDKIIQNVISYDFTSSYPYVMISEKYPMREFKINPYVKRFEDCKNYLLYIFKLRIKNYESLLYNNFISSSRCKNIEKAKYDNGRLMKAESFEIYLTSIDVSYILKSSKFEYEILECYSAYCDYLPKSFINFILLKYKEKTQYKNVKGKELEYSKAKNRFNSLYGMSVTNNICDDVLYDFMNDWQEIPLTNSEIEDKLIKEKQIGFMPFSWGVFVTAYARKNLIENIIKLDDYVIYSDTDSLKLSEGFDRKVIESYNENVIKKLKKIAEIYDLNFDDFMPKDKDEKTHLIGVFDEDGKYEKFITQGAKKYCVTKKIKNDKINEKRQKILKKVNAEEVEVLELTVSGVPKIGAHCLNKIEDFKDNLVFKNDIIHKNSIVYTDNQEVVEFYDYLGNKGISIEKSGCCIIPAEYTLKKSIEYTNLLCENHSLKARWKENE